jgi:hypothetical protein
VRRGQRSARGQQQRRHAGSLLASRGGRWLRDQRRLTWLVVPFVDSLCLLTTLAAGSNGACVRLLCCAPSVPTWAAGAGAGAARGACVLGLWEVLARWRRTGRLCADADAGLRARATMLQPPCCSRGGGGGCRAPVQRGSGA